MNARYFGNIKCVEGYKIEERDMKNMDKSSFSTASKKYNDELIEIILDESGNELNFEAVIDTVIDGRQKIKDSILSGEQGAGSPAKFRGALHYAEPFSYHANVAGEVWNRLFGMKYGKVVDGERIEIYKFHTPKVGVRDPKFNYIEFTKDKLPEEEYSILLETYNSDADFSEWINKGGLKYIGVPKVLGIIPKEILKLINVEETVEANTTSRAARLYELIGIDFVNTSAKVRASNIIEF